MKLKVSFGMHLGLMGLAQIIAPCIYDVCEKKNWSIRNATTDNAWVTQIDTSNGLSLHHLQEFMNIWAFTSQLHLVDDTLNSII
jgi:hypothetical protein